MILCFNRGMRNSKLLLLFQHTRGSKKHAVTSGESSSININPVRIGIILESGDYGGKKSGTSFFKVPLRYWKFCRTADQWREVGAAANWLTTRTTKNNIRLSYRKKVDKTANNLSISCWIKQQLPSVRECLIINLSEVSTILPSKKLAEKYNWYHSIYI